MTDPLPHPLSLDSQLCFSLYGASIAMNRVYKPMLDRLGITYPQYLVLHALWEEDGRTIGVLAERLSLESSTITPLVKRLEAAGFVTRARNPGDERHVHVRLTQRGEDLRKESVCLAEAVFARTGMSYADVQSLTEKVQRLRQALVDDDGRDQAA
jgi:DNA-binding MarR family transcriptional regulator